MDRVESLITEETVREDLIKDETADLLALYSMKDPTKKDVSSLLEQHYILFGRIGFNSPFNDRAVDYMYEHLTGNSQEYLSNERAFIEEVMSLDLQSIVVKGVDCARNLVPEQDYKSPQAVFLLNGKRTEAKVLGNNQFGINLQNIFSKIYLRESNTYDLQKALQIIKDNSAHESTHLLVEQITHDPKEELETETLANNLIIGAFNEGLATFAEEAFHFPWSDDYLQDSNITLKVLKMIKPDMENSEKLEVLKELCNMESLKKHKLKDIENVQLLFGRESISDRVFESEVRNLLIAKNGPLYYAGYAVWRKIYETGGIEKVREVVKRGPGAFMEFI